MTGARSALWLAGLCLAAGLFFDSAALLVPGVGLVLVAALARAWVALAARSARVERARGPASVVEGEQYPLRIVIRRGAVPPWGEVTDPLLDEPVPVHAAVGRRTTQVSLPISFPRRGRHRLDPATLVVRDPLRMYARAVRSEPGGELLVLPRVEPVLAPDGGGGGAGDGDAAEMGEGAGVSALDSRAIDFEVDGLRPYREGSPASRIHWKAVARTGELIERRLVAGGDQAPLVVLDAERPDSEEALDRAVRAAASLCVHVARDAGGCTLLCPGERRPLRIDSELRSWPVAHAALAVVEAGARGPSVMSARSVGAVVWVSARGGRPPRAARGSGAISILVSPSPLPGYPVRFRVAGCHGQSLASTARRRRAVPEPAA